MTTMRHNSGASKASKVTTTAIMASKTEMIGLARPPVVPVDTARVATVPACTHPYSPPVLKDLTANPLGGSVRAATPARGRRSPSPTKQPDFRPRAVDAARKEGLSPHQEEETSTVLTPRRSPSPPRNWAIAPIFSHLKTAGRPPTCRLTGRTAPMRMPPPCPPSLPSPPWLPPRPRTPACVTVHGAARICCCSSRPRRIGRT